jgi:hypothetical protein
LEFKVRYVDIKGRQGAEVACLDSITQARNALASVVAAAPAPPRATLLAWDFSTLQPGETRRVTEHIPKARDAAYHAAKAGGFTVRTKVTMGPDGAGLDVTRVRSSDAPDPTQKQPHEALQNANI